MSEHGLFLDEDLAPWFPGEERRASVRLPASLTVSCRPLRADEAPREARVRDASPLGAGLLFSRQVGLGTLMHLDFARATQGLLRSLLGRVIHATPQPDGWAVGCAFIREVDDATLRRFEAQRTRAPMGDNRRWVRFPCNVETACSSLDATAGEQSPARVMDVSAGGLGLLLPCEFGVGTLLRLLLPIAAGHPGEPLLLRVARAVTRPQGDWFLGCEFADHLSDDELAVLLG
jgi:hypothetical protein